MHLTNYALNKENTAYKQAASLDDDRGHKRAFSQVIKRLQSEGHNTKVLMSQIHDLIVKTLLSV